MSQMSVAPRPEEFGEDITEEKVATFGTGLSLLKLPTRTYLT